MNEKYTENKGCAGLLRNPAHPLFSDFFHRQSRTGFVSPYSRVLQAVIRGPVIPQNDFNIKGMSRVIFIINIASLNSQK